ncbi:MAG: methionyl-tRNA formyltransferase, partial [Fidelibacterota bacterium]
MRVLFMGTPDFAVPSLHAIHESRHQLVAVVTIPDKASGRGLKLQPSMVKTAALTLGYPVLQPESLSSDEFLSQVRDCYPDIIVVVAFQILPKSVFEIPKYGAVNIHASLLPKYRGAAPIQRAILAGENETGVSTFQITKKVDTGSILLQRKIEIGKNETCGELWERLSKLGAEIIVPTLDGILENKIIPVKQDNALATSAKKID